MFDLGFSELLVIGIVALVVIGPERLPKVARSAGQWLGRLNRYVAQVKQDIDRDMKLEELRKMQQEMKESAQRFEIMANDTARDVETAAREMETTVEREGAQISKVMQAMSSTDGGLTMKEWDRIKAEEVDVAKQEDSARPPAGGPALAEAASPTTPSPDEAPASDGQASAASPESSSQPARRDYPDGSVG